MEEDKVEFNELLVSIKSTRNVNEIKEKLDKEQLGADALQGKHRAAEKDGKARKKTTKGRKNERKDGERELEDALEEEQRRRKQKKVLEAPLHRQARDRIESRLAYRQTKEVLREWDPIVNGLRVAEQLQFPHDERHDDPLRTQTAEERAKTFTPRTELELRMAEVLANSKHTIHNGDQYSQAERELLKAMDVKEAQQKCAELRKMRALISFQAAKLKRQSKIKSKQFHRIRKRHQRRELIKEVEQLFVRDPKQADEKLAQLEEDRAYERATLKHRGTNKWTKQMRKFASRDPELRKRLEDQLRLGRELKARHGVEGADDEETEDDNADETEEGKSLSSDELVKLAANEADRAGGSAKMAKALSEGNPFCRSALENIRRERKAVARQARTKAAAELTKNARKEGVKKQNIEIAPSADKQETDCGEKKEEEADEQELFLDLNVRPLVQLPTELAADSSDTDAQQAFLAEAYADDDVLADFQKRKAKVEHEEKPKAKASAFLRGWGAWTGPGISEASEKRREIRVFGQQPAVKEKRRRDAWRPGVIIREQTSEGIKRLQPRDVPFPFTRIQDYEAYIRQPLGRDWNTPIAHAQLTKPAVLTKNGRIIRPLGKEVKKRKRLLADIIDGGD